MTHRALPSRARRRSARASRAAATQRKRESRIRFMMTQIARFDGRREGEIRRLKKHSTCNIQRPRKAERGGINSKITIKIKREARGTRFLGKAKLNPRTALAV